MPEKRGHGTLEGGSFFSGTTSFDIEDSDRPRRRRRKPKRRLPEEDRPFNSPGETSCPGCGNEIERKEFLDALISFVIGAYDHGAGNPIRARFIQSLRNDVGNLQIPNPKEAWELEIVHRIENQVAILMEAEIRRLKLGMRNNIEEEIKSQLVAEIQAQMEPVIAARLEAELRESIEVELWQQFEEAWRNQEGGPSKPGE